MGEVGSGEGTGVGVQNKKNIQQYICMYVYIYFFTVFQPVYQTLILCFATRKNTQNSTDLYLQIPYLTIFIAKYANLHESQVLLLISECYIILLNTTELNPAFMGIPTEGLREFCQLGTTQNPLSRQSQ